MRNLSIDFLRSFITIAQTGSYTACAEKLKRTQPAISLQIKKLEETIGDKLFERNGNRLNLTLSGSKLLEFGMKMVRLNDQAMSEFGRPQISGYIKLGIPSEFSTFLMPRIIGRFSQNYPEISLEVHCALSRDLLSEPTMEKFDLILALQEFPDESKPGYIKTEPLVWVGNPRFSRNLPEKLPLIAAPPPCIYRKRVLQALEKAKKDWHIVYTISDLTGIRSAIDEGLGLTVLAKSTVPQGLNIIADNPNLPEMGNIGIQLINPKNKSSEAIKLLSESIISNLTNAGSHI